MNIRKRIQLREPLESSPEYYCVFLYVCPQMRFVKIKRNIFSSLLVKPMNGKIQWYKVWLTGDHFSSLINVLKYQMLQKLWICDLPPMVFKHFQLMELHACHLSNLCLAKNKEKYFYKEKYLTKVSWVRDIQWVSFSSKWQHQELDYRTNCFK